MDLRRPADLDEALRLQMKYLPYAPKSLIKDYLSSLLAAFTKDEMITQLNFAEIDRMSVNELEDRYIEISGFY